MTLKQLESFVWVARLRSFRAAAAQLGATQPAISVRVAQLESELGLQLIDRDRRGVNLTPEGHAHLAHAERILLWTAELRALGESRAERRGRVRLGVSELIAHTWLPALLMKLNERFPAVEVDPTIDLTPDLLRRLENGEYDVILVGLRHLATTFPTIELGSAEFCWMEAGAAKRRQPPLSPIDLAGRRIITWSRDSMIYSAINDWFVSNGAFPIHRITCNTAATMAAMAAAGLGTTLLPPSMVRRELKEGRLSIVRTKPAFGPLHYRALYVPGRQNSLPEVVARTALEVSSFDRE
jgi:DNA-binding transcriptional LysR family regulator